MQFVEKAAWFPEWGISYLLGIDGISLLLVLLTTFLTILCVLVSWKAIQTRVKEYYITFLFLETAMIGTLCALDLVLFYIFWELMLIPMYLLIGIWGGPRRIYAAIKFFLFTMVGSVLMLLAIFVLYFHYAAQTGVSTFNVLDLYRRPCPSASSTGSSPPSPSRSPSRCPCSRSTRGCPTRTPRRRRQAASSWPACS